ncbi:hypothetical protein SprV_0401502700 [Sparganum proliferum]
MFGNQALAGSRIAEEGVVAQLRAQRMWQRCVSRTPIAAWFPANAGCLNWSIIFEADSDMTSLKALYDWPIASPADVTLAVSGVPSSDF